MAKFAVVLPAAGKSSRFKDKEKKPFANLDGRAVWLRTAELFVIRDDVVQCVLVVAKEDQEMVKRRYGANMAFMNVTLADGGAERFESVANALAQITDQADFVAVHDAVRPCLTTELINAVFSQAAKSGAAILAVPVTDTLKYVENDRVLDTPSRRNVWLAQTPQVFRREWLIDAYARRQEFGDEITDDAQLVAAAGHEVHVVPGSTTNIKITTKEDVMLADAILKARPKPKAKGPIHPFAEDEMWGGRG
ncbi:MAG: 2-C-methyl-D-erythritol 4-phosphate cytidylyltransferase [Gemmatales bacterium]|nr:MAG: 2-C-methyl-D-erythritol 4-phosphate cytidylyltransferase [Gemmatales bacterium]